MSTHSESEISEQQSIIAEEVARGLDVGQTTEERVAVANKAVRVTAKLGIHLACVGA